MNPGFHPWRRKVDFVESREAAIRPLIESLSFIEDKQRWGYPFRVGLFEVPEADFFRIAAAMGVEVP